jgi:hypothetical protein
MPEFLFESPALPGVVVPLGDFDAPPVASLRVGRRGRCIDCKRVLRLNDGAFWPFVADDESVICDKQSGIAWGHRLPRVVSDWLHGEDDL